MEREIYAFEYSGQVLMTGIRRGHHCGEKSADRI